MQAKVDIVDDLMLLGNLGTKLLQISRSTPYLTTALIGHKSVLVLFTSTLASKALPAPVHVAIVYHQIRYQG